MRLKTLELQGFKSFADKTVLTFDHGMTAVVGPNGSGKSNISDAMRWVLGEISSKSIRGHKMEDVIFGGTDNRRPMGFAEVSLTIDNTDPDNKMAIDYDEVTVTRRYYRSGESEYMINRKPVRLKDITELFMNTGIGRGGYSMVGQGKAAEIISTKSDERRNIFEEAAGIAKYRQRKNEAERKLTQTDENLFRVNDILSELEGRVGPLEKDAAKARKYLELFEAKKALDVAISIFDISDIENKAQKLNSDFEIAKHELEMAEDTLRSIETRSEKLYEISQANKLRYEELNRLIRESNEKKFGFETSGKVLENDISHINEAIEASKSEKQRLSKELEGIQALLADSRKASEEKKDQLTSLVEQYNEITSQISDYDEKLDALGDDIDKLDMELNYTKDNLVNARIELSAQEASGKSRDDRRAMIKAELAPIEEAISLAELRIKQADETIAVYQKNIDDIDLSVKDAADNNAQAQQKTAELKDRINTLILDINTKKHRISNLKRMEELFEGYTGSVRSVMGAADNGELKGIIGPVSKVIQVDSKYAVAIETSLGAAIQNIICENEENAKSAIRYLKDNRRGRATFYPLTSVKPQYLNGFNGSKGFIGLASELVSTDSKYQKVIDFLLARTAIFDNIDNATQAAKANGYKVKCVTLDGQQINAGGSFTGGSLRNDSGILSRSAEMEKATAELEAAQNQLKLAENELSDTEKQANTYSASLEDADAKKALFNSLVSAEGTQKQILTAQLDADKARKSALEASLCDIDNEETTTLRHIEEEKQRIAQLESVVGEKETELRTLIKQREELTLAQSDLGVKNNAIGIEIERKKKDIEASEYEISIRCDAADNLTSKMNIEDNKISAANEKLEQIYAKIAQGRENADTIDIEIANMTAEIESITAQNLENEAKETKLREERKDVSHRHEVFLRDYTRLETQCVAITSEKDKLTAHLWDEYELSFSAALELGYPEITESSRQEAVKSRNEYRSKIKTLGSVNVNAIEEYEEVKNRYDFLKTQFEDLTKSKSELAGVIYKLESEMRTRFTEVLEQINKNFKEVFVELFGGGTAHLSLTDPENVLESGIEINVAPPGKIIKNLSLLSGGEQAFVSIALFFAILKVNPTPFCVLDEIEAALDEVNVTRFAQYCQKYSDKTQFIVITHRRGTMETSDTLYGVTMYERGVSKVLSVNVSEVEQKLGVKL